MNGWSLSKTNTLEKVSRQSEVVEEGYAKVRITHMSLTEIDVQMFQGKLGADFPIIPVNIAVGVVAEVPEENSYLNRGDRVVLSPYIPCGNCIHCKSEEKNYCKNMQTMGVTTDGFLCDFVVLPFENIFVLPERVSDLEGLFVPFIAYAVNALDSFSYEKGDFIAVGSCDVLGNIIGQLALFYQLIPIMIDTKVERLEKAENSGMYLNFLADENLNKKILQATSGKMVDGVVYLDEKALKITDALTIIKKFGQVSLTSLTQFEKEETNFSVEDIIKNYAKIVSVSSKSANFVSAINLLANKNIDITGLTLDTIKFDEVNNLLLSRENQTRMKFPVIVENI